MNENCCDNFFIPHIDYLQPFKDKRIFLSGGTGFFGKWLLSAIACANRKFSMNVEITVLSRNPQKFCHDNPYFANLPGVDFITGDIRGFPFPERHYDYLLHAATEASAKLEKENPEEMFEVITAGTRHILDFAEHACIKKMLYVSSGAVYGPQPPTLPHIAETFTGIPITAYGKGKIIAEQMCLNSKSPTVIARCFAFVGPYLPLDTHFAIGNFINDCLCQRPLVIKGDGTPLRSYMYAGDLTIWLLKILSTGNTAAIYNVGSENAISIKNLAQTVVRISGDNLEIEIQKTPETSRLPEQYVPSTHKARTELGLAIFTPLEQAIYHTIAFYKQTQYRKTI